MQKSLWLWWYHYNLCLIEVLLSYQLMYCLVLNDNAILLYYLSFCLFVCICFFYSVCKIMTKSRKYIYFVISVIVKGNKQEKFSCIKHNHLVISVPLYHHFPHLLHVPVRLEDVSIDVHAPSYLSNLRKPYSPSLTLRAMSPCWDPDLAESFWRIYSYFHLSSFSLFL